ncbi:MAG: hypothetical protein ACI8ZN_002163 [Bacteroidia bacterium]|jgi:hypothetical protein
MNPKTAIKTLLYLFGGVVLFHVFIVLKLISYDITWGGRLKSDQEMYVFEIISILINLFLCFILLVKGKYIKEILPPKVVNVVLWIFLVLFGLNTIGNILAETTFEKFFGILTLAASILIWIILKKEKKISIE